METSRKLGTFMLLSSLCFLSGGEAQLIMSEKNGVMEVIKGQMVVLQAYSSSSTAQTSLTSVTWTLVTGSSKLVISYPGKAPEEFEGRVGFVHAMPNWNVSLFINNTKETDSGRYLCQVITSDSPYTKEVTLDVKVPPSVPVCSLKGKPVLKGNVTLTCSSKYGKPVPLYRWTKASPNQIVFFAPQQNETAGILKLTNLTSDKSGKYVCNASNTAGTETCYINLEVITATNAGVIAGATVGSVVGFILILLVFVFLWTRRRDTEDDLANDIKEDAQAPKRVSWAKSGTGSLSSKNGTLSSVHTSPLSQGLHHSNLNYTHHPPSDTASILTATGSTAGYRPRPPSAGLPGYNTNATLPHSAAPMGANAGVPNAGPPSTNGGLHAHPQVPRPPPVPTGMTAANISRMGGVPIMVPAQNQAGSLV